MLRIPRWSRDRKKSLITHVILALVVGLCVPKVYAQDQSGFYKKNFAEGIIDSKDSSQNEQHPAFGQGRRYNKNAQNIEEFKEKYQQQLDEIRSRREALPSGNSNSAQKSVQVTPAKAPPKAPQNSVARDQFSENQVIQNESQAFDEDGGDTSDSSGEESDANHNPFEPINPSEHKSVVIDMVIGATPPQHLVKELGRAAEVSKIKGVTIGEVYVVGQPPFSEEFVTALRNFRAGAGKVNFVMEPPDGKKFEFSPVWTVKVDGKTSVFEGNFNIREIFISR